MVHSPAGCRSAAQRGGVQAEPRDRDQICHNHKDGKAKGSGGRAHQSFQTEVRKRQCSQTSCPSQRGPPICKSMKKKLSTSGTDWMLEHDTIPTNS